MRPVQVLSVFTRDGEGGNKLGFVADGTDLETQQMQAIATDLGFAETVFLDWVDRPHPYVRIFTPGQEMMFAGHPLVGTAWAVSWFCNN